MIPLFKPCLGKKEEQAVIKTLRSGWLGNGPQALALEQKLAQLTGTKYAVALNSATAALHLSLLTTIKPGDEVISSSLTFVAANQAILQAGGKIVFADCDEFTLSTDTADVIKKISVKTKAVIVTHYGGMPADLQPLVKICRQKKIALIEDCAHAAGSYYRGKHVGGFGTVGCFSFAAIKNITTGDGGMVVTNSKILAERIRHLAWSGISSSTWVRYVQDQPKAGRKWEYDVTDLGFKYQMNDLAASIGLVQFDKLNQTNGRRAKITGRYNRAFKKISWIKLLADIPQTKSSHHNYVIKVYQKIRDRLIDYLNQAGISANVHYLPNHLYKMFRQFPHDVPVTDRVWRQIVLLPIFPDLSLSDQNKIMAAVRAFK
ncbi:DegT/DnrJ/EryC1/StrS aminotransferase family protein [Candidatus Beckwithbacteria bacterium CG_4_10_14_0_2_um_filter_47_25]|uniref:DegT/DnrJ/EryC1/StrS aminotransferase family protein n=2 Tax=Candidatus Beckwithiibacteriota TaxID=1752726 RepID=A0A2M7W6G0_9BACT|nr:MAG: DegT/DnrJ/EryC1/StrS aminotransferase family protein [Candidatus Beckwithbacteria bacterium CG_4_10_14_0_2_um_filter_47_25]